MWHASVAGPGLDRRALRRRALAELEGVGDAGAGEWLATRYGRGPGGGAVFHLRRRLAVDEAAQVGPLRDIRGTDEVSRRVHHIAHLTPWTPAQLVAMEEALL